MSPSAQIAVHAHTSFLSRSAVRRWKLSALVKLSGFCDGEVDVATPSLTLAGGVSVSQPNAIIRSICRKSPHSALLGRTHAESALVDSYLDTAELDVATLVENGHVEHLKKRVLVSLEEHLTKSTFLPGPSALLSAADVSLVCELSSCFSQMQGDFPAVSRWVRTVLSVKEVQETAEKQILDLYDLREKALKTPGAPGAAAADVVPAKAESTDAKACVKDFSSAVGGRIRVRDLLLRKDGGAGLIGQKITVCGWVKTKREQGGKDQRLTFVELSDGSMQQGVQLVITGQELGSEVSTGSSLSAVGTVVESPAKGQKVEVAVGPADKVVVLGGIVDASAYPLAKKGHTREYLREIAHLRPRSNLIGSVARMRSSISFAVHSFFNERGFQYVHTPLVTAADCEGAGEMFQVTTLLAEENGKAKPLPMTKEGKVDYSQDFFAKPAFLTVSGQLSVENYCCGLGDVYTFGPTFRAENSHTSRHLAEFWMVEPELAFADLNDDMDCAEAFVKYIVEHVLKNNMDDIEFFNKHVEKGLLDRLKNLIAEPFKRLSYTEAIELLMEHQKAGKVKFENTNIYWGFDMDSEHERYITEKVFKKPVIVYNYPKDIKAFYMRLNDDEKTVAAMDVLVPMIGELIGGSQREERLDVLDRRITEMGLEVDDYWWYRDLRKFGTVPHAGFGLGLERMIMLATGVENIRDVIPFPRFPGKAEF